VLWFVIGFSLTFSKSHGGFIGGFDNFFFLNIKYDRCFELSTARTIPGYLFATF